MVVSIAASSTLLGNETSLELVSRELRSCSYIRYTHNKMSVAHLYIAEGNIL